MKNFIEMNGYRQFTVKERLQILIGYNLKVQCLGQAQHNPGKIEEKILCQVTSEIPDPKTFRIVDPKPTKPETL